MEQYRGWLWWWGDAAGAHPIYTLAIICPLVTPTHQTPFNVTIARVRHCYCYCPLSYANFILTTLPQFEKNMLEHNKHNGVNEKPFTTYLNSKQAVRSLRVSVGKQLFPQGEDDLIRAQCAPGKMRPNAADFVVYQMKIMLQI